MRGHSRKDSILGDFCDEVEFQTHPLFAVEVTSLQLMIYFDELELCNPLGSKSKIHKVG